MVLAIIHAIFSAYTDEVAGFWKKLKAFIFLSIKKVWSVVAVFAIGYIFIVYPVYFLFTRNYSQEKQTGDTSFILASFAGGPTPAGIRCKPMRCLAELTIFASKYEATRPFAEYTLGVLMVVQRSSGGNTSYFLGEISAAGSRLYFPIIYALKETLPTLIFVFLGIILSLIAFIKSARDKNKMWRQKIIGYFENNFAQFSFVIFIAFYLFMSVKSPLNIGFRHLMPVVPLIYILLTGAWKKWFSAESFSKFIKASFLIALLLWFVAEIALASPYFLSYFNEAGGSVGGGYRYATDSNYDWGQDLSRLKNWVDARPEIKKIAVNYFGGGSPEYYMPEKAVNWWSAKGNPANQGIHYLAVSVNALQDAVAKTAPEFTRDTKDEYEWLKKIKSTPSGFGEVPKPDFRVGTSMFIYKL